MNTTPLNIYFVTTLAGPVTFQARVPPFTPGTLITDVRSDVPLSVLFTLPAVSNFGACVVGSVAARDQWGNLLRGRGQTMLLTTQAGGQFFSSMDCTGSPTTSLSGPYPDSASFPFSFRTTSAGTYQLRATLQPSSVFGTINHRVRLDPVRLSIAPGSLTGYSDVCNVFLLQKLDAADGGETFDGGETVTFSGPPELSFFDPTCVTPRAVSTPPAGTIQWPIGVRAATDGGTFVFTATESALGMATAALTVPGRRPTRLAFSVADSGVQGVCYPGAVGMVDSVGLPAAAGVPSTISFFPSSSFSFGVYSQPNCPGSAISSIPVPSDQASINFWWRQNTNSPTASIDATSSLPGFARATAAFAFTSPPAYGLQFNPASTAVTVGTCAAATLQIISDAGIVTPTQGSEVITLIGNPDAGLVVGTNCATVGPTATVIIADGQSSSTVTIRQAALGSASLSASSPRYGSAALSVLATNPCRSYGQACGPTSPCCPGSPQNLSCTSGTCRCNVTSCIPRGQFNCGSSNNCCSGVISGSTCQ